MSVLATADDGPVVEIDLAAVAANWRAVVEAFGGRHVGAVVKHDAYGLGAARVAPWLEQHGCRHFWVDTFEEGHALRALLAQADSKVFVMHGLAGRAEADFAAHALVPVVASVAELQRLRESRRKAPAGSAALPVAVQLDVGLTRLGLCGADLQGLGTDAWQGLQVTAWVAQLSRFDHPEEPGCLAQRERFVQWTSSLPTADRSLAASACVFCDPLWHLEHARVGSALYGVATGPVLEGRLKPAVTLRARVLRVMRVSAGTGVGYGASWRTPAASTLATLAVGYGHGLPPAYGERGEVMVQGRRVPLRGGSAMGLSTADISALAEGAVKPGDWVEVYGAGHPLHEAARAVGLPPNALLVPTAKLSRRVHLEAPRGQATS